MTHPDHYTPRLGRRTAKLLAQCLSAFVKRHGYKLTEEERAALYRTVKPLVDWIDKGPPARVQFQVEHAEEKPTDDQG